MATITKSDIQTVVSLSKEDGREALRKCLNWDIFDEDWNMRRSIHLDFIYDSVMFASEKGFTWDKVAVLTKFAEDILQQIQKSDSITEILSYYNRNSGHLLAMLGDRDYKIYTTFIFETILPHFKLYKYVFTIERQEQIPNIPCKVEPPFDAKTLKDTKPLNVWDYEKRLEELEKKENERVIQRKTDKEQKLSEVETGSKDVLEKVKDIEAPLDKEKVGDIIQEVMKQFTLAATINLTHKIEDLKEDMEFKLEKTSLPRPPALAPTPQYLTIQDSVSPGPPPRYTSQAVKAPSSKQPKSPKPGSRLSGKAKKK